MAYNNKNALKKEAAIKKDFEKLYKRQGHRLRYDYILHMLAEKYYLSARTVGAILNGEYERNRIKKNGTKGSCMQSKLFEE